MRSYTRSAGRETTIYIYIAAGVARYAGLPYLLAAGVVAGHGTRPLRRAALSIAASVARNIRRGPHSLKDPLIYRGSDIFCFVFVL